MTSKRMAVKVINLIYFLVPIDFSYTTSYRLSSVNSNFCCRTYRLAIFIVRENVRNTATKLNKKAVLPQGNRAMPQVFFSVEVRQQHSLQV